MSEISIETLQSWRSKKRAMQIVDIREIQEFQLGNLGGDHIPMAECLRRHKEIRRDIPVVVHCRTGRRSEAVVSALAEKHGFENLRNLAGGIMAWALAVDPSIQVE